MNETDSSTDPSSRHPPYAGKPAGPSHPAKGWEPPTPEELSTLLAGYEITALLGRGGMGVVYKGVQLSLDREVAIKLLPPDLGADPEFQARFRREAKAMAKLNHPHIVQIYDYGQTASGQHYFVMEFVDGSDLQRLVRSGKLNADGALITVSQVCDALQYAHELGFVHRDIKPANILINRQGTLKVGDFGLAKLIDSPLEKDAISARTGLTQAGMTMGTPHYAAPEQLDGECLIDHRADLYSLGIMLYEMLTGDVPRGAPKPPSRKISNLDVRLDGVVFKAMDPDPNERYQSATALRNDVENIRTTPPQLASLEEALVSNPQHSRVGKSKTSRSSVAKGAAPVVRKSRGAIFAILAGILALGGLFAWIQWPESPNTIAEPLAQKIVPVEEVEEVVPVVAPPLPATTVQPPTQPPPPLNLANAASFVNTLGMRFVPVPILGGPTGGKSVWFCVWETRVQDYEIFAKEKMLSWPKPSFEQGSTHPAVLTGCQDAQLFCSWLTDHERKAGRLGSIEHYRLPTDHEWSCAVGIGSQEDPTKDPAAKDNALKGIYPWGKTWPPPPGAGNFRGDEADLEGPWTGKNLISGYRDDFPKSAPVGSFSANSFGLFDLSGNVWEWCEELAPADQEKRVARGSAWGVDLTGPFLSSSRHVLPINFRHKCHGFRVVLSEVILKPTAPSFSQPSIPLPVPDKDGWVDLLPAIDPSRDALRGVWRKVNGTLVCSAGNEFKSCALPLVADGSYDLRLVVERTQDEGYMPIFFRKSGYSGAFTLNGIGIHSGMRSAGLERLNKKDVQDTGLAVERPTWLPAQQSHELILQVRDEGVSVQLNGVEIYRWKGSWSQLSQPLEWWPSSKMAPAFALGTFKAGVAFESISWRPVVGTEGRNLPAIGAKTTTPTKVIFTTPALLAATKNQPFRNSLGMKFVPVPIKGGPTDGQQVLFSVWETRVQDYAVFAKEKKLPMPKVNFPQSPLHPVVSLLLEEVEDFRKWLTERERKLKLIGPTEEYRLPTDHEMSCALGIGDLEDASAQPSSKDQKVPDIFPWGTAWPPPPGAGNYAGEEMRNKDLQIKNFRDKFRDTAPVGSFDANPFGLYDLGGNAAERTAEMRNGLLFSVLRGGSVSDHLRSSLLACARTVDYRDVRSPGYGMRFVLIGTKLIVEPPLSAPAPPPTNKGTPKSSIIFDDPPAN